MYTENELAGKTPEELVKIVIAQSAEIKSKQDEIDLTVKVNGELTAQVENLSKNAPAEKAADSKSGISKETFVVDKKKYGFKKLRVHYNYKGKDEVITANEVLASKDLQKELVEKQSGMIVFIENVK